MLSFHPPEPSFTGTIDPALTVHVLAEMLVGTAQADVGLSKG